MSTTLTQGPAEGYRSFWEPVTCRRLRGVARRSEGQTDSNEARTRDRTPRCSSLERGGTRRNVYRVLSKDGQRYDFERPFMSGRKHHKRCRTIVVRSQPVPRRDAPAIPGYKSWEPVLMHRSDEIVADAALMVEEFRGHDGTNRVAAEILGPGVAAPISKEPGDRVETTRFEFSAQDVAFNHRDSIAQRTPGRPPREFRVRDTRQGVTMR